MRCIKWRSRSAPVGAEPARSPRPATTAQPSPSLRAGPLRLDSLEPRTLPSFGITTSGSNYVVDTGADVVFRVARSNADITSITFHGNELMAPYSVTHRYSHYESGLSSTATTVTTQVDLAQGTALITATDHNLGVTQYYAVHQGDDVIYMATYAGGSAPPTPGEMRYIFYLDRSKFNVDPASDTLGRTVIEGSDVFADTATGFTYSKYYSEQRNIDSAYHGVTGPGVGAFMMIGSREKGSGGPFFKDIFYQGSAAEELYNYMYSGHAQTEPFRPGLQGPYALEITDGSPPAPLDYSFMDNLGITGWVPAAGRGAVIGRALGVPPGYTVAVGLSNANAQYWSYASPAGRFYIGGVLPGTYTETLYANELVVGSQFVTVTAGATTGAVIQDATVIPTPIWSIGTWDGTPNEFLNEPALASEHPSDSRMMPWANINYVIGSSTPSSWPTAQWKAVNNDNQIVFTLTAAQAAVPNTLRIGITDAFAGGRPQITVNTGHSYSWRSALPAPSTQPTTRSITLGTYRGNNTTFLYNIPTSALVAGTNTIDISVNSGSGSSGFLSAAVVYDAIDFMPTSSVPAGGAWPGPTIAVGPLTSAPAPPTVFAGSLPPDLLSPNRDPSARNIPADATTPSDCGTATGVVADSSPDPVRLADHALPRQGASHGVKKAGQNSGDDEVGLRSDPGPFAATEPAGP